MVGEPYGDRKFRARDANGDLKLKEEGWGLWGTEDWAKILKKVKTHTLYIHNIKYLLNFIHYVYLNLITSITSSMKAKINKSNDNNCTNEYQQV